MRFQPIEKVYTQTNRFRCSNLRFSACPHVHSNRISFVEWFYYLRFLYQCIHPRLLHTHLRSASPQLRSCGWILPFLFQCLWSELCFQRCQRSSLPCWTCCTDPRHVRNYFWWQYLDLPRGSNFLLRVSVFPLHENRLPWLYFFFLLHVMNLQSPQYSAPRHESFFQKILETSCLGLQHQLHPTLS